MISDVMSSACSHEIGTTKEKVPKAQANQLFPELCTGNFKVSNALTSSQTAQTVPKLTSRNP